MTLAFASSVTPLIQSFGTWTGGSSGLALPSLVTPGWLSSWYPSTDTTSAQAEWITVISLLTLGVALFFMSNLFASRSGRAMRLVRDNDVAAELAGVSLGPTRTLAFVVSAAYASLGGALLALTSGAVSPGFYSIALSITILSLIVLGGMGSITGALIGGIIYAFSDKLVTWLNSLTGIDPVSNLGGNMKGIIFGSILILTMLLAPQGLVGLIPKIRQRISRSRPRPSSRTTSRATTTYRRGRQLLCYRSPRASLTRGKESA
jgi:branched-chain amino acid transport system permease protein